MLCYTLMHVYERLGWKQQQQQRQCPKVGQEVPRGIKKEVCMLLRLLLVALANFIAKKTLGRASFRLATTYHVKTTRSSFHHLGPNQISTRNTLRT